MLAAFELAREFSASNISSRGSGTTRARVQPVSKQNGMLRLTAAIAKAATTQKVEIKAA
jgi:hypothetical protein